MAEKTPTKFNQPKGSAKRGSAAPSSNARGGGVSARSTAASYGAHGTTKNSNGFSSSSSSTSSSNQGSLTGAGLAAWKKVGGASGSKPADSKQTQSNSAAADLIRTKMRLYMQHVIEPVMDLSPDEAIRELQEHGIPIGGPRSSIFTRLIVLRLFAFDDRTLRFDYDSAHRLIDIDAEYLIRVIQYWDREAHGFEQKMHPCFWDQLPDALRDDRVAALCEIFTRLNILLPTEMQASLDVTSYDKAAIQQRILSLLFQMRSRLHRQSAKKIETEKWVSHFLGYSLDDLDAPDSYERVKRLIAERERKAHDENDSKRLEASLWKAEYDSNKFFALSCLKMLFLKTLKAREIEVNHMQSEQNEADMSADPSELSFRDLLGPLLTGQDDPFALLSQLDLANERRQKTISMQNQVRKNVSVSLAKLIGYLPSSSSSSDTAHRNYAYIDHLKRAKGKNGTASEQVGPVVWHKVSLSDGTTVVTEIGIRCDGFWFIKEDDSSATVHEWMLAIPDSAKRLEWSPNESDRESGRSLESVLFSHGPDGSILSDLYIFADDELLHIDLKGRKVINLEPNTSRVDCACSFSYIRYRPSGKETDPIVFLRVVLFLHPPPGPLGDSFRKMAEASHSSESKRITEPGFLLADVFNIDQEAARTRKRPFDSKPHERARPPVVMYRVSSIVRSSSALANLRVPYRVAIEKLLGISREENDDPIEMKEARLILLELIMTTPTGKHAAVITENHATDIKHMLVDKCIIPVRWIFVEQANYVSAMRTLQKLTSQTGLSFCFAKITNRLSALDIGRMIDTVQGTNVRLLLFSFPSLLFTLRVVGKLSSVLLPPSIEHLLSKEHSVTTEYPSQSQGHLSATHHLSQCHDSAQAVILNVEPELIKPDAKARELVTRTFNSWIDWEEAERNWRQSPGDSRFLVLVASESMELEVTNHYSKLELQSDSVVLDCRTNSWQSLKKKLDESLQQFQGRADSSLPPIVIFTKAHLLSDIHIRYVAERCGEVALFVLVQPQLNPQQLTIRASSFSGKSKYITGSSIRCVPNVLQPLAGGGSSARPHFLAGLFMILGPLLFTSVDLNDDVNLSNEKTRDALTARICGSDRELVSPAVLHEIFASLVSGTSGSIKDGLADGPLHRFIAEWMGLHLSSRRDAHNVVPFYWFVELDSMCQLLPQSLRVVRWMHFLAAELGVEESLPQNLAHKVSNSLPRLRNIHSLHLINLFRCADSSDPLRAVPRPSYRHVRRDNSISEQELLLQQCIQSNELPWADFESQWTVFPHSTEILCAALTTYFQPLKFLSILPLASLFYALDGLIPPDPHASSSSSPGVAAIRIIVRYVCSEEHAQTRRLIELQGIHARSILSVLRWVALRYLCRVASDPTAEQQKEIATQQAELGIEDTDVNVLIQHSVPFEIPREGGSATFPVIRILLNLDMDSRNDLISQQMHLRDYFTSIPVDAATCITQEDFPIGRMFIQFLLSPFVTASDPSGLLRANPHFGAFSNWILANSDESIAESTLIKSSLSARLTVPALALLLSRATNKIQADHLFELFLYIAGNRKLVPRRFFFDVLSAMENEDHLPSIVLSIMTKLVPKDANSDDEDEDHKHVSETAQTGSAEMMYSAVWKALRTKSFEPLAELELLGGKSPSSSVKIPLSHEALLHLFVEQHTDRFMRFPAEEFFEKAKHHISWFSVSDSFLVLSHLLAQSAQFISERKGLLFLNWLRNPYTTIPIEPSDPESLRAIERLISLTEADIEVARAPQQCANAVLALVAPFCVQFSIIKQYKSFSQSSYSSRVFCVAQKNHETLPPFYTAATERPLPSDVLEFLSSRQYRVDLRETLDVLELSYDVGSGASEELIRLNLMALLHATRLVKRLVKRAPPIQISEGSQASLIAVILLWFKCTGINLKRMRKFAIIQQKDVRERLDAAVAVLKKFDPKHIAELPLPGYIDTTFRIKRSNIVKGTSKEDMEYTLKLFAPLFADNFRAFEDKVRSQLGELSFDVYSTIDHRSIAEVTSRISSILQDLNLADRAGFAGFLPPLLTEIERIVSVIKNLQEYDRDTMTGPGGSFNARGLAPQFLGAFFEAISPKKKQRIPVLPSSAHGTLIFRLMFSRLGITTEYDAEFVAFMFDRAQENGIVPDEGSRKEFINLNNLGIVNLPESWKQDQSSAPLFDPHQLSGTSHSDLSFAYLDEDSNLEYPSHRLGPQALKILLESPQRQNGVAVSNAASLEVQEDEELDLSIPFSVSDVSADAGKTGPSPRAAIGVLAPSSSGSKQLSLSGKVVIDCRSLLQLVIKQGYATLSVKPGPGGVLVRGVSAALTFVSYDDSEDVSDRTLVAQYSSHGEAWESIQRESSYGVLAILDGLILKREYGIRWVPYLIPNDFSHFFPWEIVRVHQQLNFVVLPEVLDVINFFSDFIARESGYSGSDPITFLCQRSMNFDDSNYDRRKDSIANDACYSLIMNYEAIVKDTNRQASLSLQDTVSLAIKRSPNLPGSANMHQFGSRLAQLLERCTASVSFTQLLDILGKQVVVLEVPMAESYKRRKSLLESLDMSVLLRLGSSVEPAEDPSLEAAEAFEEEYESDQINDNPRDEELLRQLVDGEDSLFPGPPSDDEFLVFSDDEDAPESQESKIPVASQKRAKNPSDDPSLVLPVHLSDEPSARSLFYYPLDISIHKNHYNPISGRDLAYILPRPLVSSQSEGSQHSSYTKWLVDVLRSPLSDEWKTWFVRMCSENHICLPPNTDRADQSAGGTSSLVIASCLARRCPIPKIRRRLSGAVLLPSSLEPYCRRKNGQYGIYFCNTHILRKLRDANLQVAVVDLGAFYDAPQDDLYLQIVGCFEGFCCFVYVRGLRKIDDLLLKWCAEYSERCPWAFIYFENTDSMFNFSENRDRCDYSFFNWPSVNELCLPSTSNQANQVSVYDTKYSSMCLNSERSIEELYSAWASEHYQGDSRLSPSEADPRWQSKASDVVSQSSSFVMHLVSPPGAGKTFLLRTLLDQESADSNIDCSNDELVDRAMQDVLNERFESQFGGGGRMLLVADEFHMLNREQKKDLVSWALGKNIQRIVLIANRSDDFDITLLEDIKKRSTQYEVHPFSCRLGVDTILEVLKTKDRVTNDKVLRYIRIWCSAARALFGEESLSLRSRETLVRIFSSQNRSLEQPLASFLLQKLPNLGEYTCWQFAHEVCMLASKQGLPRPSETCHPMQLLVRAAVQDTGFSVVSFPEFCARLKTANKYHPLLRLAAWVRVVYDHVGIEDRPPVERLFHLRVIDQVGFPLILSMVGEKVSLTSALAFVTRGEYSDLDWLASTVQHGYSINWAEVKELWRRNFVTDVPKLKRLVSVCPAPNLCLGALDAANLAEIIEAADHTFARDVILHMAPASDEISSAHSPFYSALWFLFRDYLREDLPDDIHSIARGAFSVLPSDSVLDHLCDMLLWASRFGYHRLVVTRRADSKNAGLRHVLCLVSRHLVEQRQRSDEQDSSGHDSKLIRIWNGVFAPLLSATGPFRAHPRAQLILAGSQFPAHSSWPRTIQKLSRVVYRRADASDLDYLRNHEVFYKTSSNGSVSFCIPSREILHGVLATTNISLFWQLKVLECDEYEISHDFRNAETVRKLEQGLRKIRGSLSPRWDQAIGPIAKRLGVLQIKREPENQAAASSAISASAERKKKRRLKKAMDNLNRFCKNEEILRFYNEHAGMSDEKIKNDPSIAVELDKGNLKGNQFDLGRDRAFEEFSILVGAFFRRTKELDFNSFWRGNGKGGCGAYLQEDKGFKVEMVFSEEEFAHRLESNNPPDQAWIISGDQLDWQLELKDRQLDLRIVRRFVDSVEKFSRSGRGLFIMGENDPFYFHANLVLERICGADLHGDWKAETTLRRGTPEWPKDDETNSAALLLSALSYLYEGSTICFPSKQGTLKTLLKNSSNHKQASLLYMDQTDKYGRICVDTGFTKLWKNWDGAGTARFYGNVAVWLLGLDHRLSRNLPIRGGIRDPDLGQGAGRTPNVLPPLDIAMELVIVLDQSGSVGEGWKDTVSFCHKVTEKLQLGPWLQRVAIVPFDNYASPNSLPLTHDKLAIEDCIRKLYSQSARGGTSFANAMQKTYEFLGQSRPNVKRLVIFETDGDAEYSRAASDQIDVMIAVAVGNASMSNIRTRLRPHHVIQVGNFADLESKLESIFKHLNARAERK